MAHSSIRARLAISPESSRIFFTAGQFARQHLCYVQEVGYFRALPGYYTERRGVASYLLVYTLHGQGELRYGGQVYALRPGWLFLIDCRQYQYYCQRGDEKWEFYWVHFHGGCTGAYWQAICAASARCPGEPLVWPDEKDFIEPIRQLIRLCAKPGQQTEILCARLIIDLLTTTLLAAGGHNDQLPEHSRPVQAILDLLHQQPEKRWTLADLAGQVALNRQYLMRIFRREIGQTPLEYQQALRIGHSKDLLRASELSIEAIALQLGFDGSNYFIRMFKKLEGLTPLAYRKRWSSSK